MKNIKKNISELQKNQSDLMFDLRHPRLGALTSLVEEVGELVKAIHEREIYGNNSEEIIQNTKEEIADCLFSLLELANVYGINFGDAYENKVKMIESKIEKWKQKYGETLKVARAKFD